LAVSEKNNHSLVFRGFEGVRSAERIVESVVCRD
jgi:hypothetical protein